MTTEVNSAVDTAPEEEEQDSSPVGEGLVLREHDGSLLQAVPPPVAGSLRYTVARLGLDGKAGMPKRLGITSPHSGDGVTYIARSLAAVIAHDREASVCLVDLNWWSQDRTASGRPGVADVVEEKTSLSEVLIPTQTPQLTFLPAGSMPLERRPVIAGGQELERLLAELSFMFDHLVVDLPPLLLTSQALTLAARCESCLIVVRQGVTQIADMHTALELIEGVPVLGVVMNRASSAIPRSIQRRLPVAE